MATEYTPEFLALVADMRHAQKEYFRTRSEAALQQSKALERKVDEALKRMNDQQKSLFSEA